MTDNGKPTLLSALLAVQAEAVKAKKTATNPAFKSKYVTLEALMDAVMPILNKHGLVWITRPGQDETGKPTLEYALILASADADDKDAHFEGTMPLLLDKQNPQGLGSAITYARRQSLMAVVGIVGEEDDDGNRASKTPPQQPTQVESSDRVLKDEELTILEEAVNEAGQNLQLLLASVGAESANLLTVSQGRAILRKLKA